MHKHQQYWQHTLRLTAGLLTLWFVVTFVVAWFARELQAFTLFGFPLSFFMAAQGALLIYVALVAYYAYRMDQLDAEYDMQEGD